MNEEMDVRKTMDDSEDSPPGSLAGAVLALWRETCKDGDDDLLRPVLASSWVDSVEDAAVDVEVAIAPLPAQFFPTARDGLDQDETRGWVEQMPQVDYLLACSTDEAAYRAFNDSLRLQRASTLMEGGRVCDFRIYAVDCVPTNTTLSC